jgi:hypothetical protein
MQKNVLIRSSNIPVASVKVKGKLSYMRVFGVGIHQDTHPLSDIWDIKFFNLRLAGRSTF